MNWIKLVYDRDCPNVDATRDNLRQALTESSLPSTWQEWERGSAECPPHYRRYGSPTILVHGRDVALSPDTEAGHCRLYADGKGEFHGAPPVDVIVDNLKPYAEKNLKKFSGVVPVLGVALLPKLTCPACWPAYAWLLGVMGLDFINYTPWLLPMMAVLLVPALGVLAYRAGRRRGYGPFFLGLAGAALLMTGKFHFNQPLVEYGGMAILLMAFVWNAWPANKSQTEAGCPACFNPEEAR
ncbi:MerC domain-containing protein [Nitrospina sp. 32_T5]|uniref:MerC domain-containing protein n=1 Tax=unclassified Nitrospina TaxID=2638683 RepID=UPI003F95BF01